MNVRVRVCVCVYATDCMPKCPYLLLISLWTFLLRLYCSILLYWSLVHPYYWCVKLVYAIVCVYACVCVCANCARTMCTIVAIRYIHKSSSRYYHLSLTLWLFIWVCTKCHGASVCNCMCELCGVYVCLCAHALPDLFMFLFPIFCYFVKFI